MLRAAGISHQATNLVTGVDSSRLIEWCYLSGASGHGGWLPEEVGEGTEHLVRLALSTDYSVDHPWLDALAHRAFFRGLISDLKGLSLRRL